MSPLTVVLAVTGTVALWAIVSFNRFISQRQLLTNSWSNVDTELRRRHDLIPNLVETVGGYATHEKATLTEVIEARAGAVAETGDPADKADAENVLVEGLRHLLAVSEAYPELVASEHFLNGNVRDYNRRVEAIPSRLIAALCRFARADYFEVESAVRDARRPNSTSTC